MLSFKKKSQTAAFPTTNGPSTVAPRPCHRRSHSWHNQHNTTVHVHSLTFVRWNTRGLSSFSVYSILTSNISVSKLHCYQPQNCNIIPAVLSTKNNCLIFNGAKCKPPFFSVHGSTFKKCLFVRKFKYRNRLQVERIFLSSCLPNCSRRACGQT